MVGTAGQPCFLSTFKLPLIPPSWELAAASKIYESFLIDVRSLESTLKSQRTKRAKEKRKARLIFKDICRTAPNRVDVLLKFTHGEIVAVEHEANTVTVDNGCNIVSDHPIFIEGTSFLLLYMSMASLPGSLASGVSKLANKFDGPSSPDGRRSFCSIW